jgi:hypothetical protein
LIIGVVLGLRFLWVGTVKVAEGIAATLDGKRGIKITGRE